MRLGPIRPVNRWRNRDARRAYLIGYIGVSVMAPYGVLRLGAAVFRLTSSPYGANPSSRVVLDEAPGRFLVWKYSGHDSSVSQVYSGLWGGRADAERDAREWAESVNRDSDPEWAGIGTFDEFDRVVGSGLVCYTLGSVPEMDQGEARKSEARKEEEAKRFREGIGDRIHELRENSPETNRSIAKHCGVGERTVAGWVAGDVSPGWDNNVQLAELFDVDVMWLLSGDDEDEDYEEAELWDIEAEDRVPPGVAMWRPNLG